LHRLRTDRLILRPMVEDDVEALLLVFSDPNVMASFGGILFDRSMMERWVRRNLDHQDRHGYGLFSVIHRETDELIGDCGLEHMEVDGKPEVEIGYDIRSDYWNRGLASEAATAVRDFAFDALHLPRVISLIRPANVASERVAEKVGMRPEKEIVRGNASYWVYALSRRQRRVPKGDDGGSDTLSPVHCGAPGLVLGKSLPREIGAVKCQKAKPDPKVGRAFLKGA
jgi:ribosomal-protein-alanine N-acetyltransferase